MIIALFPMIHDIPVETWIAVIINAIAYMHEKINDNKQWIKL